MFFLMQIFRAKIKKGSYFRKNYTTSVRVRFAPSPTGFLHLGGLRTALYNFLFAKVHKGKFLLRIEDTDQSRLVPGAIEQLQKDLTWAGIEIDEGPQSGGSHGPYIQSHRLEKYKSHVDKLLENGSAYHCFCSDRRLELLRREALKAREVPKYDNRCRIMNPVEVHERLSRGDSSCIRFKLSPGIESFVDSIYGEISYDVTANEGDPVIMKTDGFPTYHFANVVDDHCMEISHVFRGVEWQISTTKHILMYKAFGWNPPIFGHLPLLINADGTKLSKRQGDIKISHYRETGIFPLALINFIANSGGGFEKDSIRNLKPRCYTIEELTQQFDISKINSHSGKLMPERLLDYNRLELKRRLQSTPEKNILIQQVINLVEENLSNLNESINLEINPEHVENILIWSVDRINKLQDLISDDLKFIWVRPKRCDFTEDGLNHVHDFVESFKGRNDLDDREALNIYFKQFCQNHGIKFGNFMKTIRSILSGLKEGPSVAEMVEILGKKTTIERLEFFIHKK